MCLLISKNKCSIHPLANGEKIIWKKQVFKKELEQNHTISLKNAKWLSTTFLLLSTAFSTQYSKKQKKTIQSTTIKLMSQRNMNW